MSLREVILPCVRAGTVLGTVSLRDFSSDVTVQLAALRLRGRQSAIGGPRPRFSLKTVARRELPPGLPSSVVRSGPFLVNTVSPCVAAFLLLR